MLVGFVTAFPPGRNSLNEFGLHFARALANNPAVDKLVLFADRTEAGEPLELPGADAHAVWEFNSLTNVATLTREIRRSDVDAVIFNLQFATFGDTKVAGGLGLLTPAITQAMGIPTGVILHNLVENVDMEDAGFAGSKAMAKLMTAAGTALTKAILRSDYVALTIPRYVELLRDRYSAENAILVPHGSFEEMTEPSFGIPDGPRQLLAFGKWGTYKTVDVLIDAYRELLTRGYDDLEVIIAGSDSPNAVGYLDSVAATCADLPAVKFTGYVEEEDVARMFSEATAVVFPYTSTTGSSGVLHQAGSYGRAAVLPEIGDFVEVIEEEGFLGEYFIPDNASSLADALVKLIDDPTRRVDMGRRNYAAAAGIALSDVVDWHIIHLERLINDAKGTA
jgi:glycosyltransferase involved in cell wall biosynthesis